MKISLALVSMIAAGFCSALSAGQLKPVEEAFVHWNMRSRSLLELVMSETVPPFLQYYAGKRGRFGTTASGVNFLLGQNEITFKRLLKGKRFYVVGLTHSVVEDSDSVGVRSAHRPAIVMYARLPSGAVEMTVAVMAKSVKTESLTLSRGQPALLNCAKAEKIAFGVSLRDCVVENDYKVRKEAYEMMVDDIKHNRRIEAYFARYVVQDAIAYNVAMTDKQRTECLEKGGMPCYRRFWTEKEATRISDSAYRNEKVAARMKELGQE